MTTLNGQYACAAGSDSLFDRQSEHLPFRNRVGPSCLNPTASGITVSGDSDVHVGASEGKTYLFDLPALMEHDLIVLPMLEALHAVGVYSGINTARRGSPSPPKAGLMWDD